MRIKLYFAIAFALTLMVMMSSTVSAATITVDDSGGEDHTIIQAAINAANDSDTILVYPGTYTENVDVNKSLIIISQSGNPDDTNVQANNSNDHVFNVTRDNVTISGFNVTGATGVYKAGIFFDGVQNNTVSNNELSNNNVGIWLLSSSNNTLSNNTASNNYDYGIFLEDSNNNTLTNNTANSNDGYGIFLEDSNNNTLSNNTASNNLNGIFLYQSSNNNTLINNNASNNWYGIDIYFFSNNNTLTNNTASNNYYYGINLHSSSNNNTLSNNTASNNYDYGIHLSSSSNNTLTNNTASNNYYYGIYLSSSSNNNTLTNNTASNNNLGIYLSSSSNNTLTNNYANSNNILLKVNYNLGIYLCSSSNNTLISNIMCNNNAFGIRLLSSSNNNTIYNNFFNNTNNTQIDATSTGNVWNITQISGPNIIGGPFLGGNYWAHPNGTGFSQTCTDTNNDGFCDSQFDIDANNTDYLPLTINASIDIEKSTNGEDADVAPGPSIRSEYTVTWTYKVTNNGNVILNNITVIDDKLGEITCPNTTLQPGESMVCTATGTAQIGQYSNFGNVTAVYEGVISCNGETIVNDIDQSHYFGYKAELKGEPNFEVPTANPFLTAGVLGIAVVLFLRRELK